MKSQCFNLIYLVILCLSFQRIYNEQQIFHLFENLKVKLDIKYHIFRDEVDIGEISEQDENYIIKEKPIVICLGQSCYTLLKIREAGLRNIAYPFDWCVIYHDALIKLIKNDFAQLLDESLINFENHTRIWNSMYGGDKYLQTGFILAHICPADATKENFFKDFFQNIKKRMQRRIKRFRKALNSGKHVYFVRAQVPLGDHQDINRKNISELVELIKSKFPKLKFTMITAHYLEEFKTNWAIPNVINFYHSGEDNEENSKIWKNIFQSIPFH